MSAQPAFVTSRRRQHELLRSWPTWALTSILRDPAEVARIRESGWSGTHHTDPTSGERVVGTPEGLGFGVDESWHNPREVIAWSDVEAIAGTVPAEVREQLVEFRERMGEHHKAFPRFSASAEAIGCGPIVEGQPLTARQEAYVRELKAFEDSGIQAAWQDKKAALDAERHTLHDRALAAGLDRGPADLLELLETHPTFEVQAWQNGQDATATGRASTGSRPAIAPPAVGGPSRDADAYFTHSEPVSLTQPSTNGPAR